VGTIARMTELLPLVTYSIVMSSTPGPNNLMLTTSGANFGFRRTLPHILGISAGMTVQTVLTCLGLGSLFVAFPALHAVLRVVGALYLLVLAWKLAGSAIGNVSMARPLSFWQAAAFQAVNPKSWIKSVTIASVFMPNSVGLIPGTLQVTFVTVAIGMPCVSVWALFGVAIRGLLTDQRRRRLFNVIMAGSLAVLAVAFLKP
jgi:threonine/homoserine/homoserine lactone efflux protein